MSTPHLDNPESLPHAKHFPAKRSPALPPGTFDGRVVFISGGGTGLGKGMATRFSELGAKVAIASRCDTATLFRIVVLSCT